MYGRRVINSKKKRNFNYQKKMNSFNKPGSLMLQSNINEHFRMFKQEVKFYFKATKMNKEDKDVQVARLYNLIEKYAFKIYNTVSITDEDTVGTILNKFEDYCNIKKTEAMTFCKFFARNQ